MIAKRMRSELRGPGLFGRAGRRVFRGLVPGQPMILEREPANPVDRNAVVVKTLLGEPAGYVAREDAARVSPEIDAGVVWLCKVTSMPERWTKILLWRDGDADEVSREHRRVPVRQNVEFH